MAAFDRRSWLAALTERSTSARIGWPVMDMISGPWIRTIVVDGGYEGRFIDGV